ncbi:MAG: hypothetical protein ABIL11_05385 [Chloroflexota bacterium]
MITAFRQKVTVKRGGIINLRAKTLKAGDTAEVIVLAENGKKKAKAKTMTAAGQLERAQPWFDRAPAEGLSADFS